MARGVAALALFAVMAGCAGPPPPPPVPPRVPVEVNVPMPSLLEVQAPGLRERFGPPGQSRRDGGAEIWIYEAAGVCRLNLVLQRERAAWKVVHAQARMLDSESEAGCLRALEGRR